MFKHTLDGQLPPKCRAAGGRKKPKFLTSFGTTPALSALPGVTGPFPDLVTFELRLKALDHGVPAM